MATIQNAIDAGLDVLNAVEPIGPEHSPEALAEPNRAHEVHESHPNGRHEAH